MRLEFEASSWNLSLKAGIWALRLVEGVDGEEEEEEGEGEGGEFSPV